MLITVGYQPADARDTWQRALTILRELHHPDAAGIRAKLRAGRALRAAHTATRLPF